MEPIPNDPGYAPDDPTNHNESRDGLHEHSRFEENGGSSIPFGDIQNERGLVRSNPSIAPRHASSEEPVLDKWYRGDSVSVHDDSSFEQKHQDIDDDGDHEGQQPMQSDYPVVPTHILNPSRSALSGQEIQSDDDQMEDGGDDKVDSLMMGGPNFFTQLAMATGEFVAEHRNEFWFQIGVLFGCTFICTKTGVFTQNQPAIEGGVRGSGPAEGHHLDVASASNIDYVQGVLTALVNPSVRHSGGRHLMGNNKQLKQVARNRLIELDKNYAQELKDGKKNPMKMIRVPADYLDFASVLVVWRALTRNGQIDIEVRGRFREIKQKDVKGTNLLGLKSVYLTACTSQDEDTTIETVSVDDTTMKRTLSLLCDCKLSWANTERKAMAYFSTEVGSNGKSSVPQVQIVSLGNATLKLNTPKFGSRIVPSVPKEVPKVQPKVEAPAQKKKGCLVM